MEAEEGACGVVYPDIENLEGTKQLTRPQIAGSRPVNPDLGRCLPSIFVP